ncbi:hypothetical protein ACP70R_004429 [Stipagrostis hirtigluma subsp. patula]
MVRPGLAIGGWLAGTVIPTLWRRRALSSSPGQWNWTNGLEVGGWTALAADVRSLLRARKLCHPFHAHGCFYWALSCGDKLLVLDLQRMEVSAIALSLGTCLLRSFAITEAGEGTIAVFNIPEHAHGAGQLCYTIRRIDGEGANVWHSNLEFDKKILWSTSC